MKLLSRLIIAITAVIAALPTAAQTADNAPQLSDSARIALLTDSLSASKHHEDSLRMEIDELKLRTIVADSLRRESLRCRIDSLKRVTPGAPVVVEHDTLFLLYANQGGLTPQQRADLTSKEIDKLGKMLSTRPDSVHIVRSDIVTDLMYDDEVIVTFTDLDGLWAECPRDSLAVDTREIIVSELRVLQKEHGLWQLVRRILSLLVVILALVAVMKVIGKGYRRLRRWIIGLRATHLRPIRLQNVELLDTTRQLKLLLIGAYIVRMAVCVFVVLLAVPLLFSIFPQTKSLAVKILLYIWNPLKHIFMGIIEYLPNLFTIFVICFVIRWIVKMLKYFTHELSEGRLHINGFYPDWAKPTFYIVRFLLYAFMVAMIYPYLPGSSSGVFQGISVFVGLIVSLGSSTVIGNIIAGLVITYMRPFRMGDRIRVKETEGNVIEKTPLVTRIRTPKNEVVTIPNSFIMSTQTVNYSQSAQMYGLIIHTEVTMNYDVPWRTVHKLLIGAALNTPGVVDDPRPFVLQTSLGNYCAVYQLNAYVREADHLEVIYADLHENIQEAFREAGIEMVVSEYIATRDGNHSVVPEK